MWAGWSLMRGSLCGQSLNEGRSVWLITYDGMKGVSCGLVRNEKQFVWLIPNTELFFVEKGLSEN